MSSTGWMRGAVVAASLAALAACTVTPPRVYSPRYLQQPVVEGAEVAPPPRCAQSVRSPTLPTPTLAQATQEAECLMSLFLEASRGQTEIDNGNRLALLGLSTVGLFRAATHPSGKELIGTSLVGANLYAHAASTPSAQRQLILLAGAETLSCGMGAARLQALDDGERGALLEQLRHANDSIDSLNGHHVKLHMAAMPHWERVPPEKSTSEGCKLSPTSACAKPLVGMETLCKKGLAAYNNACSGRAAIERQWQAPAELALLAQRVTRTQGRLAAAVAQASSLPARFNDVGTRLWRYTERVQIQVGAELARSEPDAKAILALAQGMRPVAATLGGAPALQSPSPAKPPATNTATAQSSGSGHTVPVQRETVVRMLTLDDERLIESALTEVQAAEQLARTLEQRSANLLTRLRESRAELDRCSQDSAVAQLRVVPDVDELKLKPGATQSFQVSGGAGTPQAALTADASTGSLSRALDGSFVFKVAADAAPGATAVLRFSDGAQRLNREVHVLVEGTGEAAAAKVPVSNLDLKELAKALGVSGDAPNDKALRPALESCLRDKLLHDPPDPTALSPADLDFIRKGRCRA